MKKWCFAALILLSFSLYAEDKIETIELQYRLATEVLPVIKSLMPKNNTDRAFQNIIIIKAEPSTLAEVRKLIQQLDKPPKRIKIAVIKTDMDLAERIKIPSSTHAKISNNDPVTVRRTHHWSTKKSSHHDQQYLAQEVSGSPVTLFVGQVVSQHEQWVFFGPQGGISSGTSTSYLTNTLRI